MHFSSKNMGQADSFFCTRHDKLLYYIILYLSATNALPVRAILRRILFFVLGTYKLLHTMGYGFFFSSIRKKNNAVPLWNKFIYLSTELVLEFFWCILLL